MKKRIVRVLCGVLAVQLALSNGMFMLKAENITEQEMLNEQGDMNEFSEIQQEVTHEEADKTDQLLDESQKDQTEGSIDENVTYASTLTVKLQHAPLWDNEHQFTVYLKDTDAQQIVEMNAQTSEVTASFVDLAAGSYVLCVESAGYASYEQKIEIETGYNYSIAIAVDDSAIEGIGYMPYGDLNKDGIVNKDDVYAITDLLEEDAYEVSCDLDGNGKIDLLDLEKAVRMLFTDELSLRVKEGTVVSSIIPNIIQGTVPDHTIQEGNISDLLAGTGSIALSPAAENAVISTDNPVEFSLEVNAKEESLAVEGLVLQTPKDNQIDAGTVEITYMDQGQEKTGIVVIGKTRMKRSADVIGTAQIDANGQLTIKLDGQIAVKKVTITITSMTKKDATLAEITSVEFVNKMENFIPAPVLDIPEVLAVNPGNKTIDVSWKKVNNITGYQVLITLDGYTETIHTTNTSIEITNFRNKSLENKKTYTIAVQSVNGDWKSGYEQAYKATPIYDSIPDAPDSLKLSSDYRMIQAVWTAPKDNAADSYNLYYKKQGDTHFTKVSGITSTNHTLYDLDDETAYVIYVTAVNTHGESPASLQASITTKTNKPVQFSQYRIINEAGEKGELSKHIVNITRRSSTYMYHSALDEDNAVSALGIADNDFSSYYQINDWDDGVMYHTGDEGWGLTVQLDQRFQMDRFAIAAPDDSTYYTDAAVYYWDNGVRKKAQGMNMQRKTDSNGRAYYEITLSSPIETDKVQFGLQVYYYGTKRIQVAELRLYEYDSLADDIQALYADDLCISLNKEVKETDFDQLQTRIDTKINGDYHPQRAALQAELDAARKLYEEQTTLNDVLNVSTSISASYDSALKLSGLNAWQPLGISAQANDEIVIYVGSNNGTRGSKSKLQLVVTQQHSEYDQLSKTINLNVGRNVITIPELISTDVEKGGALYIQYTGNNTNDEYAVRVNGGTKIPVLNLYGITDEDERMAKIEAYVEELRAYVEQIEQDHDEDHNTKFLFFSFHPYDEKTCIYNTTDILLDHMMISVPATQVLAGLGDQEMVKKLSDTVDAMDDMMELFYQHKGLSNSFAQDTDASIINSNHLPKQHLNIRYMKMFSGAFMYAGGNHIGIEWDSTKELILNQKPVIDENGRLLEGSYFGWGIAHEIGHQINQGAYSIAEITNNYFAVLAQADGTNDSVRFSYEDVYKKVTSNTIGYSSNVFTQLGMYWQLHLAYDDAYAQKMYDNYQEIFDHLLFARVDSYARNTALFNNKGYEVSLTLSADKDQDLMRLVSAAAEKDLTEFFTRWGFVPNEETSRFMNQFEEESRAIYYINDDAKSADLEGNAISFASKNVITDIEVKVENSDVILKMMADEAYADQILGYEIVRVTSQKGTTEKEIVGFTTSDTFIDSVTFGSRAVSYEVYAIDLQTNKAQAEVTETVKVISDGNYDKSQFEIMTNMISDQDHQEDASEQDPCEPEKEQAIHMAIDGDKTETYIGQADQDPYILIDLKQHLEVSALRYYADTNQMNDYVIEVSVDGKDYMKVAEGSFQMDEGCDTVYFTNGSDPWVTTYDIRYIKITASGQAKQNIGIIELDILGPSGDNIEFANDQGDVLIGRLSSDFIYDEESGQMIPEGSIVFAGSYKGNPAYNVVVLYDQDGLIVGGTNEEGELIAQQIILAPDPGNALLGEVSEGKWIYWIEPDHQFELPSKVKAELYRVDNALTNEGERLTSDTVYIRVPDPLKDIEIEK